MGERWPEDAGGRWSFLALAEAQRLGHAHAGDEHLLVALLHRPDGTLARQVLDDLGVTDAAVEEQARVRGALPSKDGGAMTSAGLRVTVGMAAGFALAAGAPAVRDEDVLLALAYGGTTGPGLLRDCAAAPDAVVDALAARGVPVPPLRPPAAPALVDWGPTVYFPAEFSNAVVTALVERFPPDTWDWGWNVSQWRDGDHHVSAQAGVPLADLVREVVGDPDRVREVGAAESADREREATLRRWLDP